MEREDEEFTAPVKDADGPIVVMETTVMCGTGAQFKVRSYGDSSDPLGVLNELADKLMSVGLRQRAIQELPDLVKTLAEKERTIEARKKAEREMLERRPGTLAQRLRAKEDAEKAIETANNEYNAAWAANREGPVVVNKAHKSKMEQLVAHSIKLANDYQNAIQEEAAAKVQFDANTAIWDAELAEAKRLVAEAEKVIAGE